MRIAVASDDGISIAGHFGRCAGFLIFDVENGDASKFEYRINSFGHHQHGQHEHEHGHDHVHGEGHHSHDGFIGALADCQAVICRGMGRGAVDALAANGIKPAITAENISAQDAAKLYAQGDLKASTDSTCCSH
jgi:predicted Fe-Mo cluster-binding NifX family protein